MSKKRIKTTDGHTFFRETGRAFTFVEVVMALAIVSIALLGLIRMHIISINMSQSAEITAQAVFLAQEKLAEISAQGYPDRGSNRGSVQKNALCFDWKTEVADLYLPQFDRTDASKLREISVDVNWKQGNHQKQLHMSTCVADRRLQ